MPSLSGEHLWVDEDHDLDWSVAAIRGKQPDFVITTYHMRSTCLALMESTLGYRLSERGWMSPLPRTGFLTRMRCEVSRPRGFHRAGA